MPEQPIVTVRVNNYLPLILAGVLLLINLFYPSRVWTTLLWAAGGLAALGIYWISQLARGVSCQRTLRAGWVQVGDRLEERFVLQNASWLPVLWAELDDASDLPGYKMDRVASCGGSDRIRWTTSTECTRRGVFTLGPWSLHMQDPFGFFSLTLAYDQTLAIAVYPPVVHLPEIVLPKGLASGASRTRWRAATSTIDASQTRFYQAGDPLNHIHWPSTAHRGDWIVREPDAQVSGNLWIVLDLDQSVQAGEGEESTEEYGIILAASLADRTLRQNRAVGLAVAGSELALVSPGRGKGHMWRILRSLATVRAGGLHHLSDLLSSIGQTLGQSTTVLVITPSCEPDWPDALLPFTRWGIVPTVVLLDPDSFAVAADGPDGRTEAMRQRLVKAGIITHIISQGHPFHTIVRPKRRGHWEFKVTPMGRAIVVQRPE
ncbi:MAG: DUF58 domain-containing protein [Anaerolineae bacterium]|nr:DUF58 domain-containing protein [Anaerolineae bacterium]